MVIWAHTLFKNEERWLWYSVTSVIDHVDKLLLWDTGSTDKSWQIAKLLKEKYEDKIELKQYGPVTAETFPKVRQKMLEATNSDWFLVIDADEIWWQDSIVNLLSAINNVDMKTETIIVPAMNLVGDVYHFQDKGAGKYQFGRFKGNYSLRAIKRNIEGLCSVGNHGVWGWADGNLKQIQERNTFKFVNAPYLHTTFLPRSGVRINDINVPKRVKKLKYELGIPVAKDFYYPESFFMEKPDFIISPWMPMSKSYKVKAFWQTPLKKIKRRFVKNGVGY